MRIRPVARGGMLCALAVGASSLAPVAASSAPNVPRVISVTFSGTPGNYTLTITGRNFGVPAVSVPSVGDAPNFWLQDDAQLGAPGSGEWGATGDANALDYLVWTAKEIQVGGAGVQPGDAVVVAIRNATTGRSATWGGTVAPVAGSTPQIATVGLSSLGHLPSLRIAVVGHGFGPPPRPLPFVGDIDQFSFSDPEVHCGGSVLTAGGSYFGARPADAVTLRFTMWSDTKIVATGFAGAYGSGCNTVNQGDAVAVNVWSSAATTLSGPQTAHRGALIYPGISH